MRGGQNGISGEIFCCRCRDSGAVHLAAVIRRNRIARWPGKRHIAGVKILVNCTLPFALAHGGQAIQIQQTMAALAQIGVTVEPLRWWDENQRGDLIHYFGRMPADQIHFAHQKKIKVLIADLLTAQGSQTPRQRLIRRLFRWGAEHLAPRGFAAAFQWEPYRLADGFTVLTDWEKWLMHYKFGAATEKIFVVPNGVEEVFFNPKKRRVANGSSAPPPLPSASAC